jgi:hypothetical protein
MKDKVSNSSRRHFFSRAAETITAVGAGALIGSTVRTEAKSEAVAVPSPPVTAPVSDMVTWPCDPCGAENRTPTSVFDSLKFNLRCRSCARVQMYRWHLMKFDPNPIDHRGSLGSTLTPIFNEPPTMKPR